VISTPNAGAYPCPETWNAIHCNSLYLS
jgi:hypothetical protein